MPYPNEHAFRVRQPSAFEPDSFRRKRIAKGVDTILGKLKGGDAMTAQAYRFDKEVFTFAEARDWMKEHGVKYISAEKASEPASNAATNPPEADGIAHSLAANMSELVREDELDGEAHWVAPVVLMTVGVHNSVYYPQDEMAKFPEAWNGRPLPVRHPVDSRGGFISANSPEVIERQVVGQMFGVSFDGTRLKGEAWISKSKLDALAGTFPAAALVKAKLERGEGMDVSTGVFVDEVKESGEWGGEKYRAIATNYRPDHLALLPDEEGACNWEDGAGMPRVNSKQQGDAEMDGKDEQGLLRQVVDGLRALVGMVPPDAAPVTVNADEGRPEPVLHLVANAKMSLDAVREAVCKALREKYPAVNPLPNAPVSGPWALDIYGDEVVFELGDKIYKVSYSGPGEDGSVVLGDDKVEVRRVVSYEPVGTPTTNRKEEKIMDENRKEKVDALLANAESGWLEEHRQTLQDMPEGAFLKVYGAAFPPPAATPAANVEPPKKAETLDELLANASDAVKAQVESAVASEKARKDALVGSIKANAKNKFTDEELASKPIGELERISDMLADAPAAPAAPAANMAGRSTSPAPAANAQDDGFAPPMPALSWDK